MPIIKNFSQIPIPQTQNQNQSISYDYEMGSLLLTGGNFTKSLPYLKKALQASLSTKNFSHYFSCYSLLFQALNELGEQKEAQQLYKNFKQTCDIYNISVTHKALIISAYYNIYIEKDFDQAKQELNSALKTAFNLNDSYVKADDRVKQNDIRYEIILCLYVYSVYYLEIEDYENCIQELKNLKILLKDYLNLKKEVELDHSRTNNVQKLQTYHKILEKLKKNSQNIQKIQLGVKFIEACIELYYTKNYKQAEKLSWDLYEEANKTNLIFYIPYILCLMTVCYIELKNTKQAQMFFNLAKKNVNKERKLLTLFMNHVEQYGQLSQREENDNYDLIFDIKDHLIVEKQKGCIELKNQFILMDLLKLLLLNPGVPYSKEKIIQKVWKQDYLPEIHDNKIYVTIKRLREMIEFNSCKPRYICRNNAGYHFSAQAKVLVKQ